MGAKEERFQEGQCIVLNVLRSKENNWEKVIYYGNQLGFRDYWESSLSRKETGDQEENIEYSFYTSNGKEETDSLRNIRILKGLFKHKESWLFSRLNK